MLLNKLSSSRSENQFNSMMFLNINKCVDSGGLLQREYFIFGFLKGLDFQVEMTLLSGLCL